MTYVLLVRHGENEWVKKHRLAGWIEGVHLNDNGREQAKALAKRLAHLPVKTVYSSPLERCWQTAEFIAHTFDLEIEKLPGIGEVRYGEWEGEKIEELAKKKEWFAVQHFPSRFAFPAGESLRGVQQRAVDQIEALAATHNAEMIVVVAHADVIKLALAYYLGVHIDLFQRIVISPASVSVLALGQNGGMRVLRLNDNGPLQAPPPPEAKQANDSPAESTSSKPEA